MKLELSEIKKYISTPLNAESIDSVKKINTKLNVHVNGIEVAKHLENEQLQDYENDFQKELRKKLAISNRFLFKTLTSYVHKIFYAKGGLIHYDFSNDKLKQNFKDIVNNIYKKVSLRKWMEIKLLNKYFSDPNGIVLFENKEGQTYPTIKSIQTIHDYKTVGRILEYVIFAISKDEYKNYDYKFDDKCDYFRVYDDNYDYLIKKNGEKIEIIEELSYKNPWGYVPGFIISDRFSNIHELFESPIECCLDLFNKYLRTNSIKVIYEFLHGFPKYWQYVQDCIYCEGTGKVDGALCPYCKGKGKDLKQEISKIIGLTYPEAGDPIIAPNLAGYISPDLPTWEQFRIELDFIYKQLQYTLWGTVTNEKGEVETATARILDIQPVYDVLNIYAEWGENTEKLSLRIIGDFHYKNQLKGISIIWGKRFLIESADVIYKEFVENKKNTNATINDYRYNLYLTTEFKNNPDLLAINEILSNIEPYKFYSVAEMKEINMSEYEINKKMLFITWRQMKSDLDILEMGQEGSKKDFEKFINENLEKNEGTEIQTS